MKLLVAGMESEDPYRLMEISEMGSSRVFLFYPLKTTGWLRCLPYRKMLKRSAVTIHGSKQASKPASKAGALKFPP